jgi:hypothetical protein
MLAALPIILGTQLCLSWLNFDVASEPRQPISSHVVQSPGGGDCAACAQRDQLK